jgi:hypothetical protein
LYRRLGRLGAIFSLSLSDLRAAAFLLVGIKAQRRPKFINFRCEY